MTFAYIKINNLPIWLFVIKYYFRNLAGCQGRLPERDLKGVCVSLDEGHMDPHPEPRARDHLQREGSIPHIHETADGLAFLALESYCGRVPGAEGEVPTPPSGTGAVHQPAMDGKRHLPYPFVEHIWVHDKDEQRCWRYVCIKSNCYDKLHTRIILIDCILLECGTKGRDSWIPATTYLSRKYEWRFLNLSYIFSNSLFRLASSHEWKG